MNRRSLGASAVLYMGALAGCYGVDYGRSPWPGDIVGVWKSNDGGRATFREDGRVALANVHLRIEHQLGSRETVFAESAEGTWRLDEPPGLEPQRWLQYRYGWGVLITIEAVNGERVSIMNGRAPGHGMIANYRRIDGRREIDYIHEGPGTRTTFYKQEAA